jgi:hypothetical protein
MVVCYTAQPDMTFANRRKPTRCTSRAAVGVHLRLPIVWGCHILEGTAEVQKNLYSFWIWQQLCSPALLRSNSSCAPLLPESWSPCTVTLTFVCLQLHRSYCVIQQGKVDTLHHGIR